MATGVTNRSPHLERYLARLVGHAVSGRAIPAELAEDARRATGRRFQGLPGPLSRKDHARVRGYFWGVVRRQSIQSRGAALKEMRTLYLLLSVADDLRAAGRTDTQILCELEADYAGDVPPHILLRLLNQLRAEPRVSSEDRGDNHIGRRGVECPDPGLIESASG